MILIRFIHPEETKFEEFKTAEESVKRFSELCREAYLSVLVGSDDPTWSISIRDLIKLRDGHFIIEGFADVRVFVDFDYLDGGYL